MATLHLSPVAAIGTLAAALLAAAPAHAQLVPYPDLLLRPDYGTLRYFPLSDASPTLQDLSPAAQSGAYAGNVAFGVQGPYFDVPDGGRGARFDGVSARAEFSMPSLGAEFDSPDGVTLIAWFRTASPAAGTLIGSFNQTGAFGGFEIGLGKSRYWGLVSAESIAFAVPQGNSVYRSASILVPTHTDGDWHMIACGYAGGVITMWYDGLPQTTTTAESGNMGSTPPPAFPVTIGCMQDAGVLRSFKSTDIANVSIHDRLLGHQQIRELWETANGYTGQAVYESENIRPWVDQARTGRADVALLGDSNTVITVNGRISGHLFGFAQALKARFPIYASSVLPGVGMGGWGNTLNGISPLVSNLVGSLPSPPFIDAQVPPRDAGFPTAVAYAPDSQIIPGTNAWRGPIEWESPEFPFDFTGNVDFHFTYATFAEGEGVFRPRVQNFSWPFTALAGETIVTAPLADEIIESSFRIPAGPRISGQNYTIQINDYANDLPAEGPFAFMYSRFVVPGANTGVSLTPLWAVGARSAKYAADRFTNGTSLSQLGAYLRQIVRHQAAGSERLLVHIMEGGNDANDAGPAIDENGGTTNLMSISKSGQKQNTRTLITRIRNAWIARGFDPDRLHFLLGPYHPAEISGPKVRYAYVRGWRELAREHPEWNITVMDGFGVSSIDEFIARGWYDPATGQPHLSHAGYMGYGDRVWQALFDSLTDPASGACCEASGCRATNPTSCTGTFRGPGSLCGSLDNPIACCPVNFNASGGVSVQDIFDFLAAYFEQNPASDFNASGQITVQDIFDFLSAYFVGC